MIIDFHAHIFPDKIASTTVSALQNASGNTPYSDGTKSGIINALNKANVNYAINLPVLTKPSQFDSVTKFALSLNEEKGKIISFAGVHPALEDIPKKMETVKNLGFKGVKIHPDYQDAFLDDDGYVQIIKEAKRNDLIVVTHAGVDEGFSSSPVRSSPQRILSLLDKVGGYDKLVLAHLGGNGVYSEVWSAIGGDDVKAVCV
jgi:predicted TIM-barrel fold metal-dependent hydrolase